MTAVDVLPVEADTGRDGLDHFVCCLDDVTTYCGSPSDGEPATEDTDDVSCVVCMDLARGSFCPRRRVCVAYRVAL